MGIFGKKKKKMDIGKPEVRYCSECGKRKKAVRNSMFDNETGREVCASYRYICTNWLQGCINNQWGI